MKKSISYFSFNFTLHLYSSVSPEMRIFSSTKFTSFSVQLEGKRMKWTCVGLFLFLTFHNVLCRQTKHYLVEVSSKESSEEEIENGNDVQIEEGLLNH